MPYELWVDGRRHAIAHATDLLVRPDWRRRGLSRRVSAAYVAAAPLSFAWLNEGSLNTVRLRGRNRSWRIPWLVRPLDAAALMARVTRSVALGRVGAALAAGAASVAARVTPRDVAVTVRSVEQVPPGVDALLERARDSIPILLDRGAPYLTWRFVNRPGVRYEILVAERSGACCGWAVFRMREHSGVQWAHLVDFLAMPDDGAALAELTRALATRAQAAGAVAVRCVATLPAFRRTLMRCGFLPWPTRRPGWFHVRDHTGDPALEQVRSLHRWHLTYADGDAEMSL